MNSELIARSVRVPLAIVAAVYVAFMFVAPFVEGRGSWEYVQSVWDRWQGLNVGMLALASSVTAFYIARFNADRQRLREFAVAKAFLPHALSELVTYFEESSAVFRLGWNSAPGERPNFVIPTLPGQYREVFGNCIRHADPAVGDYLAKILAKLQVHDSRLQDYMNGGRLSHRFNPDRPNLLVYMYRLGELQALVARLFDYARNREPFESASLTWDDFHNAFGNLRLWPDEFETEGDSLEAFTKRAIGRNSAGNT
ncbi:hypothetical protein [Sinimarinibacterium flocculans]|uniref:Uncharacterized protein n=1 Tax=Sinimarinibacterium flocculans TaxID=985250 RepID=A0A318ECH1_9GAMM|nr:hypothetical protein [Sinimarinibacterium flocculans]PXV69822.1 hypothetical protein C8D93_103398 [Sinimarinibacterium flocculans]